MMKRRRTVTESGDWLKAELLKLGCDDPLANNICFATGQRQAMMNPGEDLMVPCRSALERYGRGEWDTPGAELADRLFTEAFGNPPDRVKLLKWLNLTLLRKSSEWP